MVVATEGDSLLAEKGDATLVLRLSNGFHANVKLHGLGPRADAEAACRLPPMNCRAASGELVGLIEAAGSCRLQATLPEHALLFDTGRPNASGHYDALSVAFRSVDNVGSAIGHLSRLNHTACSLTVYTSPLGLLRSHHAKLASRSASPMIVA